MRKTFEAIKSSKGQPPLVCLTAYTAPIAAACDNHCDMLLVGDSVSMVLYGEESTQQATMDMMIAHGRGVVKSSKNALIIVDMPYGSYEESPQLALENAKRIISETNCQAVKLEGGSDMAETIKILVDNDIPVVGHIGLLPQSVNTPDGFKVQGRDQEQAQKLMQDAKAIEAAGAFCFVIEAVPESLAGAITASVTIPTIGIGASNTCDGQILVTEDMLGLSVGRKPKFVKQYAALQEGIQTAISKYAEDVRAREFPSSENTYKDKAAA
ncbi:MAG: 3-methyl-2-oxobutanoate hydroxymethyltransferase [Alphaproteobacteria bacterium]|nr:3-methyl-2-oxobutanoate hydroxymethyltransferase [Alphaproteobacteria bacterium]